ncbi:MAG: DNA repair protein RecO [Dongiaceae bacterium]
MEWTEEGIVLAVRRHGEGGAVVTLLTRGQGRHAGLVRGAFGPALRGVLQPGNRVRGHWRARLAEHLGHLAVEPVSSRAAAILDDPLRLAALDAVTALAEAALPEREPHPGVHDRLEMLLELLVGPAPSGLWGAALLRWELALLAELGFGLDLASCAVTGGTAELAYVSPRTGRAVSRAAAAAWRDRLLPLPAFLLSDAGEADRAGLLAGLTLTGRFLERDALAHAGPAGAAALAARARLAERWRRLS